MSRAAAREWAYGAVGAAMTAAPARVSSAETKAMRWSSGVKPRPRRTEANAPGCSCVGRLAKIPVLMHFHVRCRLKAFAIKLRTYPQKALTGRSLLRAETRSGHLVGLG